MGRLVKKVGEIVIVLIIILGVGFKLSINESYGDTSPVYYPVLNFVINNYTNETIDVTFYRDGKELKSIGILGGKSNPDKSVVDKSINTISLTYLEEGNLRTWEGTTVYLIRPCIDNKKYGDPLTYTLNYYVKQTKSGSKWGDLYYSFSIPEMGLSTPYSKLYNNTDLKITSYFSDDAFQYSAVDFSLDNSKLSEEDSKEINLKFKLYKINGSNNEELKFWKGSNNTYFRNNGPYFSKSLSSTIDYTGNPIKLVELVKGDYKIEVVSSNIEKLDLGEYTFSIGDSNSNPSISFPMEYKVEEEKDEPTSDDKDEKPVTNTNKKKETKTDKKEVVSNDVKEEQEDIVENEEIEEPKENEDVIYEIPENEIIGDNTNEIIIEQEEKSKIDKIKEMVLSPKIVKIALPICVLIILMIFYLKQGEKSK